MSENSPINQKNHAFLSQFITEGVYLIRGEEVMVKDETTAEVEDKAEVEAEKEVEEKVEQKAGGASENAGSTDEANATISQGEAEAEDKVEVEKEGQAEAGGSPETSGPTGETEGTQESNPPYQKEAADSPASGDATAAEEPQAEPAGTAQASNAYQADPQPPSHDGANQKGILILVAHLSEKNLLPKERLILTRILKAVNLSMEDVAVVNLEKTGKSLAQLTEAFSAQKILAFGIDSAELPVSAHSMNPETWEGISLLPAPSLETIAMSKQYKKQLWQNLKTLFDV